MYKGHLKGINISPQDTIFKDLTTILWSKPLWICLFKGLRRSRGHVLHEHMLQVKKFLMRMNSELDNYINVTLTISLFLKCKGTKWMFFFLSNKLHWFRKIFLVTTPSFIKLLWTHFQHSYVKVQLRIIIQTLAALTPPQFSMIQSFWDVYGFFIIGYVIFSYDWCNLSIS